MRSNSCRAILISLSIAAALITAPLRAESETERRQAYLAQLKRILPESKPWNEWLEKSKELPPDFDAMPSRPELDILTFENGDKVKNAADWAKRREELKALFMKYVTGTVPPPPASMKTEILRETKEQRATSRLVKLSFGPENKASLRVEVLLPDGNGPFPVFMTQHNHRDWAMVALSRGYIGCVYSGADSEDDTDTFVAAYPDYDWSRLMRRAWAAGRALDYLVQSVPQADAKKVVLTGHSRNGKTSLMASMIDERFAAVISSSPGAGGSCSARDMSEQFAGESIEMITAEFPDWFHPRWRFFCGREDKLPVDLDMLPAMTAPRAVLLSTGMNDNVESVWAIERTALKYGQVLAAILGNEHAPPADILWRTAGHETAPKDIERYVDWCDRVFKEQAPIVSQAANHLVIQPQFLALLRSAKFYFPHVEGTERVWRVEIPPYKPKTDVKSRKPDISFGPRLRLPQINDVMSIPAIWREKRAEIESQVALMLGEAPPEVAHSTLNYGVEKPYTSAMLQHPKDEGGGALEHDQIMLGDYVAANVYLPAGTKKSGKKLPTIIWLHPFSVPNGYAIGYHHGEQPYIRFAKQGFAVLCFDQIGFGRRIEEIEGFYAKHPNWSWMGKMVRDTHAAVDALSRMSYVDPERVAVVGYSMGAMIGLHECAFDERVKAFACVCPFEPFRLDTEKSSTGGLRRWSHIFGFMPNLGQFIGKESNVPYDLDELLASFAPRPVLVLSPQLDRDAKLADVKKSVEAARGIYALFNAADKLEQFAPEDFNRFGPENHKIVIDWLKKTFAQH